MCASSDFSSSIWAFNAAVAALCFHVSPEFFGQSFLLSVTRRFPHSMPLVGLLFKLDVLLPGQDDLHGGEGGRR